MGAGEKTSIVVVLLVAIVAVWAYVSRLSAAASRHQGSINFLNSIPNTQKKIGTSMAGI
jgi:hypothetical protein